MTDNQSGEAAAVETIETTPDAAPQAALSSQDTTSERDYEAEAREQGWRPKEEWTGKPENWKSAKVYVEHGDTAAKIAKIERSFEERLGKMEKVHGKTVEQLQRQHAKEIAELKDARRQAIKDGDADKVEKLDDKIDKLKADGPEVSDANETPEQKADRIKAAWLKENSWYENDEDLRAYAFGYSNDLADRNKNMTLEENLKRTLERVKAKYPEKFGEKEEKKPAANGHAAVDGGGSNSGIIPRKDTLFAKLPPEAKAQCAKDVAAGVYSNNEDWAKAYFS